MNDSATFLLSIIIPTNNRAKMLSSLLDSIADQKPVSFRWEVIVIENGSMDETAVMVRGRILSVPFELRYFYEPRAGLHNGRHRGAKEARGIFLAYLDDDVLLTPGWLCGIDKLMSGQAEAIMGRVLPRWEMRPPAWLDTFARGTGASYFSLLDRGSEGFYIDPGFVYGDNFIIPSRIVFELGGFHPDSMPSEKLRYRGDGESALMRRFKRRGFRAWYEPGSTAYHRIPSSRMNLDYICRRSFAQGISDSFTDIRCGQEASNNKPDDIKDHPPSIHNTLQYYFGSIRSKTLRQLSGSLRTRFLKIIPLSQPNIQKRLQKAHLAGYQFHQNEVEKDPNLRNWVLQQDYWDCSPEMK